MASMRSIYWLLLLAGCSEGGGPRRPHGTWRGELTTCGQKLDVTTPRVQRPTSARLNGTALTVTQLGAIEVPAALVGDATSVTLEVDGAPLTVSVPARPERLRPPLDYTSKAKGPDWFVDVQVKPGERTESYLWDAELDADGRLIIALPCGVVAGTASPGEVRTGGAVPLLVVPAADLLGDLRELKESVSLTVAVDAELDTGPARIEATLAVKRAVVLAALRGAATRPLAWAAPYRKGAQAPALILYDDTVDAALADKAALRDVALLAVVEGRRASLGRCGPYKEVGNDSAEPQYIDRARTDAAVTLFEARTGRKLGEKVIRGAPVDCPDFTSGTYGYAHDYVGGPPRESIRKWVAAVARR